MRIADEWQEYELIDATNGFRLERWGKIILQRPDPQVIWAAKRQSEEWGNVAALYHRSEKGGGEWEYRKKVPESWHINYKNLKFKVSPTGFKHTGVFPEQANNWDEYAKLIKKVKKPVHVLNLFAYTGGATLACLAAGAKVTHVDASKGMVAWARENAVLSGLEKMPARWIVEDCKKYVAREIRRGNRYDAVILDPPSYGRGPGGEVWKLEEALYPLLQEIVQVLNDDPLFFTLNSYTSGLAPGVLAYMLRSLLMPKFGGEVSGDELGLPVKKTGGVLPCGAVGFWQKTHF